MNFNAAFSTISSLFSHVFSTTSAVISTGFYIIATSVTVGGVWTTPRFTFLPLDMVKHSILYVYLLNCHDERHWLAQRADGT